MRYVPWIYVALCVAALALFVAGLPGIAGDDADPLSVTYAFLLAMPWVLLLNLVDEVPTWLSVVGILLGMAINFFVLYRLTRRFRRSRSTLR